jgi:hypothetical protein
MANEKISELPVIANPLDGTEVLPVVQAGDTSQASIQNISDYVKPYKVYSALLTQSGTDAPTAIVLENTIGEITLEYEVQGTYKISSDNLFATGKTFINISNIGQEPSDFMLIYIDGNILNLTESFFFITTLDSPSTYANGILNNTPIEIRVYN